MGLSAVTGIPPEAVLGLEWDELFTLADVVVEQNGGGGKGGR